MTYRFPIRVGDRVALAPHTDLWMQGVRYGIVIGESGMVPGSYDVRLPNQRVVFLNKSDLLGAVGPMPPMPDEPEQDEPDPLQDCPHRDCGYGECSGRWVNDACETHGNGEGRCQQDYDAFERDTSWRDD